MTEPTERDSGPTAAAERAGAAVLGGLARLRSDRAIHAAGLTAHGRLRMDPPVEGPTGAVVFDRLDPQPALVRLSRGAGLPPPLPDVHGLAVRLVDAYGAGRHQDLLLDSCGRPPLHRVPVPRSGAAGRYSSLVTFRVGGRPVLLAAVLVGTDRPVRTWADVAAAVAGPGLRFRLAVGPATGPPLAAGTLTLDRIAAPGTGRDLRFDPADGGPGLVPAAWLSRVRRAAYRASQAAGRRG